MTQNDRQSGADETVGEVTVETTSVFRADFLSDLDASVGDNAGSGSVSGVEGLPVGAALLVVKRGPNAGSRYWTRRRRRRAAIPTPRSSSTT